MNRSSRLALFPAAAGVVLAAGAKSSAQVVYSGPLSETFTDSLPVTLDINNDTTNDFSIVASYASDYPVDIKPQVTPLAGSLFGPNGVTADASVANQMNPDNGPYNSQAMPIWQSGLDAYLPVELQSTSATPLYGWIEINEVSATQGIVEGYAYEASGIDILTGQTVSAVPEPSSAAVMAGAMALVAGSVALWRRRQSAASLTA